MNPAAGTLTPVAGAVVNNATSVSIDFSGMLAYVSVLAPAAPGQLVIYRINPVTGALTPIAQATAPFSDDPNVVITAP